MKVIILSATFSFLFMVLINYLPSFKLPNFRQELDLFIGKNCYHIHHWLSFLLIVLLIVLARNIKKNTYHLIIGILIGCIFEDFLFRNVFSFRNCNIKK